jgi:hypothetical protein
MDSDGEDTFSLAPRSQEGNVFIPRWNLLSCF